MTNPLDANGVAVLCPVCSAPILPASSHTAVEPVGELVRKLLSYCMDWNDEPMADAEEPRVMPYCGELREAASTLTAQAAALVAAEKERDAAILAASEHARARGEAEGALHVSELAGVVDGWKARAEAAEKRIAELEAGHHKLDNDRQVFFYEQDFYVLSNFSSFNLRIGALTFPTSEHAYHYEKFCAVDGDDDDDDKSVIRFAIMDAPSAHEAFKIAERSKAERRQDWDAVKVDIMRDILRAKADQHEYVRRKLLATGDRELIEDSWRDDFWGWGPNRDGQNMLGKLWMEIRSELRALIDNTEGSEGAK